jgi:hypothetical protein
MDIMEGLEQETTTSENFPAKLISAGRIICNICCTNKWRENREWDLTADLTPNNNEGESRPTKNLLR